MWEKLSVALERIFVSVLVWESQETRRCVTERHDVTLDVNMAINFDNVTNNTNLDHTFFENVLPKTGRKGIFTSRQAVNVFPPTKFSPLLKQIKIFVPISDFHEHFYGHGSKNQGHIVLLSVCSSAKNLTCKLDNCLLRQNCPYLVWGYISSINIYWYKGKGHLSRSRSNMVVLFFSEVRMQHWPDLSRKQTIECFKDPPPLTNPIFCTTFYICHQHIVSAVDLLNLSSRCSFLFYKDDLKFVCGKFLLSCLCQWTIS